jgi:hypothetical protein
LLKSNENNATLFGVTIKYVESNILKGLKFNEILIDDCQHSGIDNIDYTVQKISNPSTQTIWVKTI